MQKKVLAINDISCVGRCSLTVALPIVSSMGVECSILPTAILSTHTGGFTGYTFDDYTDKMDGIADHWSSLNRTFDVIYTGFLGSFKQIDVVKGIVNKFKNENNLVVVDPAMADNGKMYAIFDMDFANKMKELCYGADILCPNITEACFLTDTPYEEGPHSKEFIETLISRLKKLNIKAVVLTGVTFDGINLGAYSYDYVGDKSYYYAKEIINDYFHGTGDCFASALVGALAKNKSLELSSKIAVEFTVDSIKQTVKYEGIDKKYGVCFEECLYKLAGGLYE
jgi:pyridoxine kinase